MNVKLSSIALALIATSASAFAADSNFDGRNEFVEHASIAPATSRAAVRAELDRAVAQGNAATQSVEFVEYAGVTRGKTRAEVRAELEEAYAHGGRSEFVEHTNVASGKSRDEVRAEAIRAAESARPTAYSGS